MLATRAAAKIAAGQEHARAFRFRTIQFELRIHFSVDIASPIPEQKLTEAGALDSLQELFGYDLVGVDVRAIHGDDAAGVFGEGFHELHC